MPPYSSLSRQAAGQTGRGGTRDIQMSRKISICAPIEFSRSARSS